MAGRRGNWMYGSESSSPNSGTRGTDVQTLQGTEGTLVHRVGPDFSDLEGNSRRQEINARREMIETLNKQRLNKS